VLGVGEVRGVGGVSFSTRGGINRGENEAQTLCAPSTKKDPREQRVDKQLSCAREKPGVQRSLNQTPMLWGGQGREGKTRERGCVKENKTSKQKKNKRKKKKKKNKKTIQKNVNKHETQMATKKMETTQNRKKRKNKKKQKTSEDRQGSREFAGKKKKRRKKDC